MKNKQNNNSLSNLDKIINIYRLKVSLPYPCTKMSADRIISEEKKNLKKLKMKVIKVWEKTYPYDKSPLSSICFRDIFFKIKCRFIDWKKNKYRFTNV